MSAIPENFRSYEQRRAANVMTVLEDEMEEQPKLDRPSGLPVFQVVQPSDVEIRMKALEQSIALYVGCGGAGYPEVVMLQAREFEDSLKRGL